MYIALDIGNVLCRVDLDPFILEVHSLLGWHESQTLAFCNAAHHDLGITDIITDFRKEFSLKITDEQYTDLQTVWLRCVHSIPEMTTLLEDLVKNHQVALLSNIGLDHAEMIRSTFPDVFGMCVQHFSCEVGARKPSKLYFQSFLFDNPEYKGCIFVDDKIENVVSARHMGFNGEVFALDSHKNLKNAAISLRKIILDSNKTL